MNVLVIDGKPISIIKDSAVILELPDWMDDVEDIFKYTLVNGSAWVLAEEINDEAIPNSI